MADLSEFLHHAPCPDCGSSDALAVYSDHTFCFSCNSWTSADGGQVSKGTSSTITVVGEPLRITNRKITEAVCQRTKTLTDGDKLRFYYHDKDGRVTGCKVKTKDKQFWFEGEHDGSFWGQHLASGKGKRIVITEGELDALSCMEAMPGWDMVSLPSGAAAAKKSIKANLEFLQGYAEICLWFDDDPAGHKATEEAAQVLPPGKCTIARLAPYKDASEALQAGASKAIYKAIFFDAKPYRPDGIVDGRSLLELVTTPNPPNDYEYCYPGLNELLHGIRRGELVTVTAGSGTGKSTFCRQLATSLLQSGGEGPTVGYLALEESTQRTALGLMSVAAKKPLHIGQHERSTLSRIYNETLANWNLYLFDGWGSYDPDVIYNRIEYMAAGLDCRVIFLDHLSILLSGLEGDERRMIDQTMTKLRSLVERTGISLFLVSHLRRSHDDKGHEQGQQVSLGQLRGSASIAQLSDSVIALERDQQDRNPDAVTRVRILKNRFSGETGIAEHLKYDKETCCFLPINDYDTSEPFDPSDF